ncbi:helix-turn-helix transcriptional regulator [Candidatus Poribacteria bacterium]|nr:helix-turn-helix transcriptional regulator [Candidatus Poribacteria bacterium]
MTNTFGQKLKEIRRSKGVTQRDLAEKVGVDFTYISKVENDRNPPPAADTIVKICEGLGVPPDGLLAMTGKMPTPIKEIIRENPAALQFLRQAQTMTLTADEWGMLTQQLKQLRSR